MDEIRPGLWTWTGEHPEWTPEFTWGPEVRSYAVLLTVPWHRRATDELDLDVLDEPPPGIEPRPGSFAEERAYWLPAHRAIVLGDSYMDGSPVPSEWATGDPDAPLRLRALLQLPFELVLPTHGEITDRAAFEASPDV